MSSLTKRLLGVLGALALVGAAAGVWHWMHRYRGNVVLVGDSLMYQSDAELKAQFHERGWDTAFVGGAGTGPLDDHGRWGRDLTAELEANHAKAVVIEACCNYRGPFTAADGTPVPPDSEAMYQAWAKASQDLVDRARAKGAEVFWVLTPPAQISDPAYADYPGRIRRLDEQYRDLHGVTYIDWAEAVAPFGFSPTLPGPDGKPIEVRMPDGLHFTEDGAALVAEQTWTAVKPSL